MDHVLKRLACQLILLRASLFTFVIFITSNEAYSRYYDIYRSDYQKGAFCALIGGACASDVNHENAYFQNPGSLTAGDSGIDLDGDYANDSNLEPGMKGTNDVEQVTYMAGASRTGKSFGFGFAFSGRLMKVRSKATLSDDSGNTETLASKDRVNSAVFNVPLALKISNHLSIGVSVLSMYNSEQIQVDAASKADSYNIDKLPPLAYSAGFIYDDKYFRFGSWMRSPLTFYSHQDIIVSSITSTISISEDIALNFPWLWASGFSVLPWGDERTFLFDIDIIGPTKYGYQRTYDSFATVASDKGLRQKGRTTVVEPHFGFRTPLWLNSPASILLGSYYETSRWEGLSGRIHGTSGIAIKAFGWVEGLVGIDVAKDYFSLQLTFR